MVNFASYLVWLALTLWICIAGAGTVARERMQQTLDVLLATPMLGSGMSQAEDGEPAVCDAASGRLGLAGCAFCHLLFDPDPVYLISTALMIWIYPELIAWQTMLYGLTARRTVWAIQKSLLMIAARCLARLYRSRFSGCSFPFAAGDWLMLFV